MNPQNTILIILFLMCVLYAIVLEQLHDRYVPKWLWLTVVIGNGMVIGALGMMQFYGVALDIWIILQTNAAAGAPIVAWQLWQNYRRTKEMAQ